MAQKATRLKWFTHYIFIIIRLYLFAGCYLGQKVTTKIIENYELSVAQNEVNEFPIVNSIEVENGKVVRVHRISTESAKVKEFRNEILLRRREKNENFEFKKGSKCQKYENMMVHNRTIEITRKARAHRIMIRNAKRSGIRKHEATKAPAMRILIRKAMRSAKVIQFRNEILLHRKHRIMIRNTAKNKVTKKITLDSICRIEATRKSRAHSTAIRSESIIKMNRKRKRNCSPSNISTDYINSGVKRRALRLFLKTKKERNIMNRIFELYL